MKIKIKKIEHELWYILVMLCISSFLGYTLSMDQTRITFYVIISCLCVCAAIIVKKIMCICQKLFEKRKLDD